MLSINQLIIFLEKNPSSPEEAIKKIDQKHKGFLDIFQESLKNLPIATEDIAEIVVFDADSLFPVSNAMVSIIFDYNHTLTKIDYKKEGQWFLGHFLNGKLENNVEILPCNYSILATVNPFFINKTKAVITSFSFVSQQSDAVTT